MGDLRYMISLCAGEIKNIMNTGIDAIGIGGSPRLTHGLSGPPYTIEATWLIKDPAYLQKRIISQRRRSHSTGNQETNQSVTLVQIFR
jgi:hypothetical protein